jgi:essential nuclear protein 1
MRQLVAKKYALPFLVIDALVAHFVGFADERGPLPVIWHQALLELVCTMTFDLGISAIPDLPTAP